MPTRVASERFIGRSTELAELERALACVRDESRAQTTFVTGESGVGKTRLVDELARRAREHGTRVLSGDCVDLGDSELPYAPIVSALRPLVRQGDAALDALGPARSELAQLLPELGAPAPVPPVAGIVSPQARLFEALLALLERLGRDAPVLLVLEDIHWADRSTRDFLVYLTRTLCRERVMVLATYRSDELHRRHPLRPVLAELERGVGVRRVALAPFSRDELAAQLADILGAEPDRSLVDRMWARSEGNALFVEELLAADAGGQGELPPTLRDALIVRVESLSQPAQEVLRIVAAGTRVAHAVLADASPLEPRTLRDALREAVEHGLLVADDDGRYAFRHALLREAVADDLLPGEWQELHLALAEAVERCLEPSSVTAAAAVAHHYAAAGDPPRALAAAIRAADAAERIYANGEAAAMLERALELWAHVPGAEDLTGTDHVGLLIRAANAHDRAGDHHRMRACLRDALDELDPSTDPRRAAIALERLGRALWQLGRGEAAMEAYADALALLPGDEPAPERAAVLAAQGRALMLAGRFVEAEERCRAAIDVARAAGTPEVEQAALNTLGVCRTAQGDAEGGEAALRAAIAGAQRAGRLDHVARGYVNLADTMFLAGRRREALEIARTGMDEIAAGDHCAWLLASSSEYAFSVGDWEGAAAPLADDRLPSRGGSLMVLFLLRRGELRLGRGDHEGAIADLEDARDRAARSIEPQWHAPIAALLAEAHRRARRLDAARDAVAAGMERLDAERMQDVARLARMVAAGIAVEADRAQHARDLGHADDAREAVARAEELLALAQRAAEGPAQQAIREIDAHVAVAVAEAARARGEASQAAWSAAAEQWDGLDDAYAGAVARWREAEAWAGTGDRARAEAVATRARQAAERLGARWLVEELDLLARRARLRLARDGRPAAPAPVEQPAEELGLTPREREVLALLAEGRTNREIGEVLFMAEKTASVHVSRILAKLGVRSRTEAAAVAHRLGLVAA